MSPEDAARSLSTTHNLGVLAASVCGAEFLMLASSWRRRRRTAVDERVEEAAACPTCGRFLGMRRWLTPRHAQVVVHGERAGDFAFAPSSEFLISGTVVSAMQAEGLIGLNNVETVEVSSMLRAEPAQPRQYFYGEITQQGADIHPGRSHVEWTTPPECKDCLSDGIASIRGFAIDGATWSGADIFVPRGLPGVVVVSEAFRRVTETRGFSNIELVPTERFTWVPSAAS